jgi:hypothetical protein
MDSSKERALFRGPAVLVAIALLLLGCNNSSPTEPKLAAASPAATPAPFVWTWTGTYNGFSTRCDSAAKADFKETGSKVEGTMLVPCLSGQYGFQFFGDFQGTTFTGLALWGDPEFYPLKGTLSGSSFELTIFDESGGAPMGQLHLRR